MIDTGIRRTMKAFETDNGSALIRGDGEVVSEGICGVYVHVQTCSVQSLVGDVIYVRRSDLFPYDADFCVECGLRCVCRLDGYLDSLDNEE